MAAVVPVARSSAIVGLNDPNAPVQDLNEIIDTRRDSNLLDADEQEKLDREEPYVPLAMAELRVRSMMGDLKDMKSDHLNRMNLMQKTYEDLIRNQHKTANDMLDKMRDKAAMRIQAYKEKALAINKQMITDKKANEKAQRVSDKELRAMKKNLDAIIRAKKDLDEELAARERKLNKKHEELRQAHERLRELEDSDKGSTEQVATLTADVGTLNDEIVVLRGTVEKKEEEIAKLNLALDNTNTGLYRLKAEGATVSSAEVDKLQRDLTDTQERAERLEAERGNLVSEIARLGSLVAVGATSVEASGETTAKLHALESQLSDLDHARRVEAEKHHAAIVALDDKHERDKATVLLAQQAMYDRMLKQMTKAGENEEKAKQRDAKDSASNQKVAGVKREADEAARKKALADKAKQDADERYNMCDGRLNELEAELAAKLARKQAVDPELKALQKELTEKQAAADAAAGDRDRVAKYSEEEGRAQVAKFGLNWDQVNGPLVTQLLEVCKHYNLQKAGQEDMKTIKTEHEELKALAASPDQEIAGPAKVKTKELSGRFKAVKDEATAHKAQWTALVQDLGIKDSGVAFDKDADFDELALAAEMWHEVMRKQPAKRADPGALPPHIVEALAQFGVAPDAFSPELAKEMESIVADFGKQRALQEEMKNLKNEFDTCKAKTKENEAERDNAKNELAVARAEGMPQETIDALQAKVEGHMKEVEANSAKGKEVFAQFTDVKNDATKAKAAWTATVKKHTFDANGRAFDKLADFDLMAQIVNEYNAHLNKAPEEVHERIITDDASPEGPSAELIAQVQALNGETAGLSGDINSLEDEKKRLVADKEEYEDQQQMAALAAVAANKELMRLRGKLQEAQKAADAEDPNGAAGQDDEEEEEDLTGGVRITLPGDVVEAQKELMDARFALAQSQKQVETYRQQIHDERKRYNQSIDDLESRIRELEAEIERWKRLEAQWKITAGTFYAKAGMLGQQSQSVTAHEFAGVSAGSGSPEDVAKIEKLKADHVRTTKDLEHSKKRYNDLIIMQREVEDKIKAGDYEGALTLLQSGTDNTGALRAVAGSTGTGGDSSGLSSAAAAELQARIDAEREAKEHAEAELKSVRTQLSVLQSSAGSSASDLQQKFAEASGNYERTAAELETASARRAEVEKELVALRASAAAEKDDLTGRVSSLEAELNETKDELERKNADLNDKIATLAQLEDKIRDLEAQVVSKDEEMGAKLAAASTAAAAAMAAAHEEHAAALDAQAAASKAEIDAAIAARDKAANALAIEVAAKEAALGDAAAKQARIEELDREVLDWSKRLTDLSTKYVEEQERRKYFQQEYEAAKGKIRVYARVRPWIRLEKESSNPIALTRCVHPGPNVWSMLLNHQKTSVTDNKLVDDWQPKTFDHVFLGGYNDDFGANTDNGSQAHVFKECEGFAEMAFDGLNTCIFAYGQSGSGKTWTMRGSTTDPDQWGLKPRMVRHLFQMREATKQRYDVRLFCTMFEIYNDEIQDIFERHEMVCRWEKENKKCYKCFATDHGFVECANCGKCRQPGHTFSLCKAKQVGKFYLDRFEPPTKKLEVKVLGNQRVAINGLQERTCQTFDEMQRLCDEAELLRRVRATGLNDESSRSHLIFAIHIEKKERNPKDKKNALPTYGKLSLCDLAGSERVERTAMGKDISPQDKALMELEGKRINASLSVLTSIFAALGAKLKPGEKRQLPRYRENLLTNCMQDSIGGNARTLMFVNVSPSLMNFEETKQTLSYGDLVQNITGAVATNDVDVEQYTDRIATLEEQLRKYEAAAAGGHPA
jgi:chromosome segregation ATPase